MYIWHANKRVAAGRFRPLRLNKTHKARVSVRKFPFLEFSPKSSSRTLDLPAAIAENLSYSGFYCTLDLEQNAELRILLHCSPIPKYGKNTPAAK
jgi:hypothetical protein